jgi:hypothetical protein
MIRRQLAALLFAVVAFGVSAGPSAPRADAATIVRGTPLQMLARLSAKAERYWGYSRDDFPTWTDADGEVLIKESLTPVSIGAGCYLTHGKWRSVYDGYVSTNPTRFQIDHVVALKEAWDSGAWAWTASRRRAYANDLGDSRTLRAVSAASNDAKGDKDPAQWLPPLTSFRCTYAIWWVDIKVRWRLSVDSAERAALRNLLLHCSAPIQTVAIV